MGRLASMTLLLAAFAGCQSAPTTTTFIQPAHLGAQYYLLQPQPATVKIQPHLIQPIQHLKLEPKQQQLIYYYPSVPLGSHIQNKPVQLLHLKEEETPWWQGFINFFPSTEKPAESATEAPAAPAAPTEEAPMESSMMKQQMFLAPADAENLPLKAAEAGAKPQQYYILSGTPQFYGNFDALQNPLNPIFSLQPLQAIHARANSDIQAEDGQPRFQPQIVTSNAPIAPVPALVPAQLKNDLLESHPDKAQTIDRTWARSLDDEQLPEQQQDVPQLSEGRSQSDEPSEQNLPQEVDTDENKEDNKEEVGTARQSDDPSVAAVKPTGIALAGRGGLAASAPSGTAIAGKNGLALANPSATSVAGNFFGNDEDEDKKTE